MTSSWPSRPDRSWRSTVPSPLAELRGPAAALAAVEGLELDNYYLFHAVRADFLVRLDRLPEAADGYRQALALAGSAAERRFLEDKLRSPGSGGAGDGE